VLHKTSELRGYHIHATDGEIGIHVTLTRDAIKAGPSIEDAPIDPAETVPALWIM
jgi:hypothetical protein